MRLGGWGGGCGNRGGGRVVAGRFRRDFIVRSCNVKILEVSKKKTYLWAKQRETRRLCPYTPRRPFYKPDFALASCYGQDFAVRTCHVKIFRY